MSDIESKLQQANILYSTYGSDLWIHLDDPSPGQIQVLKEITPGYDSHQYMNDIIRLRSLLVTKIKNNWDTVPPVSPTITSNDTPTLTDVIEQLKNHKHIDSNSFKAMLSKVIDDSHTHQNRLNSVLQSVIEILTETNNNCDTVTTNNTSLEPNQQ